MTNHYNIDNRYSPGSSGGVVPLGAPAAYAARWIDHCTWADVLPDRQGFAYNDRAGFQALVEHLVEANLAAKMPNVALDVTRLVIDDPAWCLLMRRAGGYVYVDAWLVPEVEVEGAEHLVTTGVESMVANVSEAIHAWAERRSYERREKTDLGTWVDQDGGDIEVDPDALADWQYEVSNGDTLLGFTAWCEVNR